MRLQTMKQGEHLCMLYSLAMLINVPAEELLKELGTNPGQKLWPYLPEPLCYRGVCIEECQDLLYKRRKILAKLNVFPAVMSCSKAEPYNLYTEDTAKQRIMAYLERADCIIEGLLPTGVRHAVACDGVQIYDPRGWTKPVMDVDFAIDSLYLLGNLQNDSIRRRTGTVFAN